MDSHSVTSRLASHQLHPVELKLTDAQAEELLALLTRMMCEWMSHGLDVSAFPLTHPDNQNDEAGYVSR